MTILLASVAALCFIYFIGIVIYTQRGTGFVLFWLLAGLFFAILSYLISRQIIPHKVPKWILMVFWILVGVGVMAFIWVQGLILREFSNQAPQDLKYIIVLGSQLKEKGPSLVLKKRLDAAYDYLVENENTICIVSGGQGVDEPDAEANGMYQYLVQKGISSARIIKEDTSRTTNENLQNSARFLNKEDAVGLVTNNFHMFRALKIASKNGYKNIYGISAEGDYFLQISNLTREFFAIIKNKALGNL